MTGPRPDPGPAHDLQRFQALLREVSGLELPPSRRPDLERAVTRALAATGLAVADQLSVDFWLVLPNDQPRVLFATTRAADTGQMMLRLQATLPPGSFRDPPMLNWLFSSTASSRRVTGRNGSATLIVPFSCRDVNGPDPLEFAGSKTSPVASEFPSASRPPTINTRPSCNNAAE